MLPGAKSHEEMFPPDRKVDMEQTNFATKKSKKAGVLVLFYPNSVGEAMLVLILRKTYKGVHSGQIGFPGGRVEPQDGNMQETALRETQEEIGVNPEKIDVLKELTHFYIPPSNFWVYPFIGITKTTQTFIPQESEVEAIIEVRVEDFLNQKSLIQTILSTSYTKETKAPAFQLNGHIVWGATGMILSEVKAILKQVM